MFKNAKRNKYFCGLDLGSESIKASLVRVQDEQNLELLGVFELPAAGLKDASISDLTELSKTIQRAVEGVCQRVTVKPTAVHLGISADLLSFRR